MVEDKSQVDDLLKELKELDGSEVVTGILGSSGQHTDKMSVVDIAAVHEFGFMGKDKNGRKMNIPERSFIRGTVDKHNEDIKLEMERTLDRIMQLDITTDQALALLGKWAEGITVKYTRDLDQPPLKPATIKKKKSSNPLIDTGKLISSITHEVRK